MKTHSIFITTIIVSVVMIMVTGLIGPFQAIGKTAETAFVLHNSQFVNTIPLTQTQIQESLDRFPGALKDYKLIVDGEIITAAKILLNASIGQGYTINPRVLLTIIEMTGGLINKPNVDPQSLDHIYYREDIPLGFGAQIRWLSDRLGQVYLMYLTSLPEEEVKFAATYAIKDILNEISEIANSTTFVNVDYLLFDDVYLSLFNLDPLQPAQVDQSEPVPFLRKPIPLDDQYQFQTDPVNHPDNIDIHHGAINSFFDHEYPTYQNDPDLYLKLFTGERISDTLYPYGCSELGVNCYDGHNALDYDVANDDPTPNFASEDILAAAKGIILNICRENSQDPSCSSELGTYMVINHESGYQTLYGHLDSIGWNIDENREWQEGDLITISSVVGDGGCTGTNCDGDHLHFQVYRNGVVVDPFGWWSSESDPWAGDERGEVSYWLWSTTNATDDRDPAFERFGPSGLRSQWQDHDGYGEHSWYVPSRSDSKKNWGIWGIYIPQDGRYKLETNIPDNDPDLFQWTNSARYSVIYKNESDRIVSADTTIKQQDERGGWVTLINPNTQDEWFTFQGNTTIAVILTDVTDDAGTNINVVFDAMWLIPHQIDRGLQYLRQHQNDDGGWGEYGSSTGITGLVTLAFLNYGVDESNATDTDEDGTPDIQEAMQFLLNHYEEIDAEHARFFGDNPHGEPAYTYDTAIGVLVLIAADHSNDPPIYTERIRKATNYLLSIQSVEDNGYLPDNPNYGGWGYPRANWSDLSNTQWAVMGIYAAIDHLGWDWPDISNPETWNYKVLRYADSLQYPDGGFDYRQYYFGASIGSMTHAGIWTNLLAGRANTHERVDLALDWVQQDGNWSVIENPGRGTTALFYYYMTLAKSLTLSLITDLYVNDIRHIWFNELFIELSRVQQPDGHWFNSNTAEWEGDDNLVTAYAILALETRTLPPNVPLSMSIILRSPADLHLYDFAGRHTGINYETGEIDLQIPGSEYQALDPQTISVTMPTAGDYLVQLIGTDQGEYELEILGSQDGQIVDRDLYGGIISEGQIQGGFLVVTSMNGAFTILSSQPEQLPAIQVVPSLFTLDVIQGLTKQGTIKILEESGVANIDDVTISISDLRDDKGNIIPNGNISSTPSVFDVPAGSNQIVNVAIQVQSTQPLGEYFGTITIKTRNAGSRNIGFQVNVVEVPNIYMAYVSHNTLTGFNSQFNGSAIGWVPLSGAWSVDANYYSTPGYPDLWASTNYLGDFADFDYQARLLRSGCLECSYGLIVRGAPTPFGSEYRWNSGYGFYINRNGQYSVFKYTNGNANVIKDWTFNQAIFPGDNWNVLKVVTSGTSLGLYINETLVWAGSDSAYSTGRAGIAMYRTEESSGDILRVDWATLSSAGGTSIAGDLISFDQQILNEAIDEQVDGDDRRAP